MHTSIFKQIITIAAFHLVVIGAHGQDTLNISFGSCNKQDKPQDYWNKIASKPADLWLWLGDNVYADTENMDEMKADYDRLKNDPAYRTYAGQVTIDGVWDDHDYGANDAGFEYPKKFESRDLYLDFLGVDSLTRAEISSRGGTYHHRMWQENGLKVCMVFLDTRWFRSNLSRSTVQGRRYEASDTGTLLGEEQWQWLQEVLNTPEVDLFIIASSIQLLSNEHGWEKWGNFPHERQRMLDLLRVKKALVLSGDRHITEFSHVMNGPYALCDFTSSGLTHSWRRYEEEPNALRVGKLFNVLTFGYLQIWKDSSGVNVGMDMMDLKEMRALQRLVLHFPN